VFSSPAVGANGTIYVGSLDRNVYALNPDGTQKWKFVTGGTVGSSPAVGADGTIYIGSNDHNVYALH
jgi:outer membrane protein assembly factor BamB